MHPLFLAIQMKETEKTAKTFPFRRRIVRAGKILAASLLVLLIIGWFISFFIDKLCFAIPPRIDVQQHIFSEYPYEGSDGYKHIDKCYLGKKDRIFRMYLTGRPFDLGYCNAVLTQELIGQQETSLLETVKRYVPSPINRWLLKKYVLLRNRSLPSFIAENYQVEIYGISRGYNDLFPRLGPLYHRLLNYHAAHDISHAIMNNPLVGCTSFAAWDNATVDGHLLLGRNFDFNAGRCFDENKVVIYFEPDRGLKFISIAWPGMIGVVTGINQAKIAVSIHAASSSDSRSIGTPVSLVLRDVMQHASTLEEAIRIIAESKVFVSDCYIIADGKTNRAAVVEKTPSRWSVRTPVENYIVCSNHFLTEELKNDAENVRYMAEGTSVVRYNRMTELVQANYGLLEPAIVAGILRDRFVPQLDRAVLGNDASINPFIATHSIIIDATDGVIWVSCGPHQLGEYIPFSLENFEQPEFVRPIAADTALENGDYERFLKSNEMLLQADLLLKEDMTIDAVALIRQAQQLNSDFYLPALLLGRIAFDAKQWDKAAELLNKAQSLYPPFAYQRSEIEEKLKRIKKASAKKKS
jgi:isopenicillin-N N-acyltransferase-like protein